MITPTIPERAWLLNECAASVRSQTLPSWQYEHLVLPDIDHAGCSKVVNLAAAAARGEWLFLLADDDLVLPGCLQYHLNHSEDADIVYSPPLVWGEDAAQFHLAPPFLPSTALIRKELWDQIGGYNENWDRTEDRVFYEEAMLRGARFVRADQHPCWIYRFWGGNKSRQPVGADR